MPVLVCVRLAQLLLRGNAAKHVHERFQHGELGLAQLLQLHGARSGEWQPWCTMLSASGAGRQQLSTDAVLRHKTRH